MAFAEPGKISQRLADDRTWMAKQMCGVDVNELDERKKKKDKQSDELVRKVHVATSDNNPGKLKGYILSGLNCIPGLKKQMRSSKAKATKLETF